MMYATPVQAPPAVTFHLGSGRREATTRVREPAGVILLYRIRAPLGTRINAWTQLPSVSAPLLIGTSRIGPMGSCSLDASTATCTVPEEWCPMPAGAWRITLRKLSGPAGDAAIWFRVGPG